MCIYIYMISPGKLLLGPSLVKVPGPGPPDASTSEKAWTKASTDVVVDLFQKDFFGYIYIYIVYSYVLVTK